MKREPRRWATVWLVATCLHVGLLSGTLPAQEGGEARLRAAWRLHRMAGELEHGMRRYAELQRDPDVTPDVRSRAALGLALIARAQDQPEQAAHWLLAAASERGAGARWIQQALALRARLEAQRITEASTQHPVERLQHQVSGLERDQQALERLIAERDEELKRKDEMIQLLRESTRQRARAEQHADEGTRSAASSLLERWVEEERNVQGVRRYLVAQGLTRCHQHLAEGRLLHSANEARRVLDLDPRNPEALQLFAHCQERLAHAAGQRSFGEGATSEFDPRWARQLAVETMKAYLAEGQRLYREGQLGGAIRAFERVLEEYALSPAALGPQELDTILAPAQHGLEQCFAESGQGAEAMRLAGQRSLLLEEMVAGAGRLLDQEQALAAAERDVAAIREQDSVQGLELARSQIERRLREARSALESRSVRQAVLSFRDVLTWLEWFPALDSAGVLARDVRAQLDQLIAPE